VVSTTMLPSGVLATLIAAFPDGVTVVAAGFDVVAGVALESFPQLAASSRNGMRNRVVRRMSWLRVSLSVRIVTARDRIGVFAIRIRLPAVWSR